MDTTPGRTVHRNVILDLLPVYAAGEASEETRALVDEFSKHDSEISAMIRAGSDAQAIPIPNTTTPDGLEMKALKRIRRNFRRQVLYVAFVTCCLLLIPLVAMQFTGEVAWKAGDFIAAAVLLFGAGLTYVLIAGAGETAAYRAAAGVGVAAGLLLVWVNLAVGIIGAEDNDANLMYIGVLFTGLIGAVIARFRPRGMAWAMFAAALAQVVVPIIAVTVWNPPLTSGLAQTFGANTVFVALFVVSGLLFRRSGRD